MSTHIPSYGQTAHKPGCPALLYPGSSCTCEIKGPVATQLDRIEQNQGKLYAAQQDLIEWAKKYEENWARTSNAFRGQLQGTADAIATALGEQSKKLQTIDTLATGLHIRWEAKFSKRKGRKRHGKRKK